VRGRRPTLLLASFADTQDLSTGDGVITLHLVKPNNQLLPGYERALAAGWSPETSPEPQHGIREQHLCEIRADPQGFLKRLTGTNRVVERLLDGTPVPPMREVVYWISDGEFSGVISLLFAELG
jgi:hypothetical protein